MDLTITSINESYTTQQESSRIQQTQTAQKANQTQQVKLNQEELTSSTATTSAVPKMDRVEISAEARKALEQSGQENQEDQLTMPKQGGGTPPPKAAAVSSENDSTSTDLTTLTEDKINELVTKGQITKAEAQTELARRAASEVPAEGQTETNTVQQEAQEKNVESEKEVEQYQSARYQYAGIMQNTGNTLGQYAASLNIVA